MLCRCVRSEKRRQWDHFRFHLFLFKEASATVAAPLLRARCCLSMLLVSGAILWPKPGPGATQTGSEAARLNISIVNWIFHAGDVSHTSAFLLTNLSPISVSYISYQVEWDVSNWKMFFSWLFFLKFVIAFVRDALLSWYTSNNDYTILKNRLIPEYPGNNLFRIRCFILLLNASCLNVKQSLYNCWID